MLGCNCTLMSGRKVCRQTLQMALVCDHRRGGGGVRGARGVEDLVRPGSGGLRLGVRDVCISARTAAATGPLSAAADVIIS